MAFCLKHESKTIFGLNYECERYSRVQVSISLLGPCPWISLSPYNWFVMTTVLAEGSIIVLRLQGITLRYAEHVCYRIEHKA